MDMVRAMEIYSLAGYFNIVNCSNRGLIIYSRLVRWDFLFYINKKPNRFRQGFMCRAEEGT